MVNLLSILPDILPSYFRGAGTDGVHCISQDGTTPLLELLNISLKIVALRFVSCFSVVLLRLLFISSDLVAT